MQTHLYDLDMQIYGGGGNRNHKQFIGRTSPKQRVPQQINPKLSAWRETTWGESQKMLNVLFELMWSYGHMQYVIYTFPSNCR